MPRGQSQPAADEATASPLAIPARRPSPGIGAELGRGQLSRNSYVPLYYQLAVILEERTESGEYAPGEEFPSEQQLCREFGVSRTVVRPAIAILEREGRVARSKGKRTIVEPPKTVHRVGGLLRILVESADRTDLEVRLLEVGRETGAPETAALLGLPPGEAMLRIAAVADLAGAPTAIYWSFVAERDFAWVASLPVGQTLTGQEPQIRRLALARAEVLVESSWCTEFEASELDIPVGSPIFVARGIEGRAGGRRAAASALEVCWAIYRASSARLSVSLGEAGGARREASPRRPERPARRARRSAG
ncbi:MAG: GntR family transcriptional regulator [Solirubrobacteraceae bacterium]|nr:GntR family transcriptional regulator [Solirubrobacteraceae bacterium]